MSIFRVELSYPAPKSVEEEAEAEIVAEVEAEIHPELFQRSVDLGRGLLGMALFLLAGQALISIRGFA